MNRFFDSFGKNIKKHTAFCICSLLSMVLLLLCFSGGQLRLSSLRELVYLLPVTVFVLFFSFYCRDFAGAKNKKDIPALAAAFILAGSFGLNSFLKLNGSEAPLPMAVLRSLILLVLFYFLLVYTKTLWARRGFCLSESPYKRRELIVAALVFAACFFLYRHYFPYLSSPDTINQWDQIHGTLNYNRIHTMGHTIFLKGLLSVYDSYAAVTVFQLLSVVLVYLLFYDYFRKKGLAPWLLVLVFSLGLILTVPAGQRAYFHPWKDTPAALCIAVVVYIILRYRDSGKLSCPGALVLGLALAWCWLFRLNGIISFVVCALGFSISFIKRRHYRQLAAMLSAAAVSIAFVNVYSAAVLKPADHENGFSIQVFASGLAAMVKSGELSEEELSQVGEVLDLEWMEYGYDRNTYKLALIWDKDGSARIEEDPNLEIFNNQFVLDLGENKKEVILLYFKLMPRHFISCVKDVIGSMHMMWNMDLRFLERYLFQFSLVAYLAIRSRLRLKDCVIFVPTACNTISIMISTITNETRYLLPSFMLMPVFFLYICLKAHEKNFPSKV